jgi:cytochrome c-type biogenesis protein CcmH/NrfG
VWHELGRLYLHLGQPDLARAALTQAAALEPSRPGLQADLAAAGP